MNYSRRRHKKQRLIWRSLFLLLFAVICSVFLVGCGGADKSRGDVNGDRIVVNILGDPKTFNPLLITDATSSTIMAFATNGMIGSDGITAEITQNWQKAYRKFQKMVCAIFSPCARA
jgi:peptide/nickel transport system substrate-binding protein